jgi:hypothetical protein
VLQEQVTTYIHDNADFPYKDNSIVLEGDLVNLNMTGANAWKIEISEPTLEKAVFLYKDDMNMVFYNQRRNEYTQFWKITINAEKTRQEYIMNKTYAVGDTITVDIYLATAIYDILEKDGKMDIENVAYSQFTYGSYGNTVSSNNLGMTLDEIITRNLSNYDGYTYEIIESL